MDQQTTTESTPKSSSPLKGRVVGVYELGKKIGKGAFSTVRKAINIFTKQEVAVKIMKPLSSMERSDIEKEISILKLLKHPNIVQLIDVIYDSSGNVLVIFELITGGDVFDHLVARGKLKEKEARKLFREAIGAIEYCHAHLVVHRDLKPENLLLDAQGTVKISDFGLSSIMKPGSRLSTYCGSPVYMAPEILMGEPYGPEVDIWSLECQNLIAKILVPERRKRVTLEMIKHDVWTCEGYDAPPPSFLPVCVLFIDPVLK